MYINNRFNFYLWIFGQMNHFRLVKNGLISSYPSLKEDINCDILVVGGGITGSLIAHQMVQDGYETVLMTGVK